MPNEPITAARFQIVLDGAGSDVAEFTELQGMTSEIEEVEFMASSGSEVVLSKLPGKVKPPTITLRRGKDSSTWMWEWHEDARLGDIAAARKSCSLIMYSATGKPVARYHLEQAWPTKVEVAALKAGTTEVSMETVTLACEFMTRVTT